MELVLERDRRGKVDTTGQLYEQTSGGSRTWLCFVLEDQVRTGPKVYGQTAIPAGRYEIRMVRSPRFARELPRLLNVPGFEGILIHAGNTRHDTEGCLLPGLQRSQEPDGTQRVTQSRDAFARLMVRIQHALALGQALWITIKDPPS